MYTKSVDVYTVEDFMENGKVAYESWGAHYMGADRMDYRIQKGFITDIAHTERILHHELDNYAMDMSKELRVAMEEAERALKKAKDLLSKEAV